MGDGWLTFRAKRKPPVTHHSLFVTFMSTEIKWLVGAALILFAALAIQSGLLAYAMYVLLGMMLLSRFLARDWLGKVTAERNCPSADGEVDTEIPVEVTLRNTGKFPVPWVLLEDLLPESALAQRPPRVKVVKGRRMRINYLRAGQ